MEEEHQPVDIASAFQQLCKQGYDLAKIARFDNGVDKMERFSPLFKDLLTSVCEGVNDVSQGISLEDSEHFSKLSEITDKLPQLVPGNHLYNVIKFSFPYTLENLLTYKPNLNKVSENGDNAVMVAVKAGDPAALRMILPLINNVCAVNEENSNALHYAAAQENLELLQLLLPYHFDLELRNQQGASALDLAIAAGYCQNILALLAAGAQLPEKVFHNGQAMPILLAIADKDMLELMKQVLIKWPEQVNSFDVMDRFSPLHLAIASRKFNNVDLLLDNKAPVNLPAPATGLHPLHLAAYHNLCFTAALLAQYGSDISPRSNNGDTPLHVAEALGNVEMIKWLRQAGADTTIRNKQGKLPAEVASEAVNTRVD